jgi:hypothetical protein
MLEFAALNIKYSFMDFKKIGDSGTVEKAPLSLLFLVSLLKLA